MTRLETANPGHAPGPPRPGGIRRLCRGLNVLKHHNCYSQAALHLGCMATLAVGVHTPDVLLCAGLYLLRMLAITAGYHRYFAHRTYKTSRAFQFLLGLVGCTAIQAGPIWWAAAHRHHHRHSDVPEDLHSPRLGGFWWSHLGWVLASLPDVREADTASDFWRFPELRWLDRNCRLLAVALAVGCFVAGGWSGFVWGFVVSTVLLYHGTFSVNSLAHLFGRQRYRTADDSRNNWLVALITLGEGWHNNHHHYPAAANQGFFWWELDLTYYVLRLLAALGIIWDLRTTPARVLTSQLVRQPPEPKRFGHGPRDIEG
jgi:stearoyl-CoA desaturase (delta-9 desaturase)